MRKHIASDRPSPGSARNHAPSGQARASSPALCAKHVDHKPRDPWQLLLVCAAFSIALGSAFACSQTTNLVGQAFGERNSNAGGSGSGSGPSAPNQGERGDASVLADPGATAPSLADAGVVLCGKRPCACSNGSDDDRDGVTDTRDPECIGPADDDEASFATGLEHGHIGACQDCFFDGNSGSGDDGCRRATSCATDGNARGGTGACHSCDVSAACVDRCRPLTPNGCDCFGCCEVHLPGGEQLSVLLSPGCSMASLADKTRCPRCEKAHDCENPCDTCELCLGKGPDDLPASCAKGLDPNAPHNSCSDGEPVCDAKHPCPSGMYCQWGCCLPFPF